MRTYTPRKNGISYFLFFLIIFSGTYTAFGQCPTVTNPEQNFCDAELARVENLEPQGTNIAWFDSQSSVTPLSSTELLRSGTYYAGTTDSAICGTRETVNVTIHGAPILNITKQSTSKQATGDLSFCLEPNSAPLTLADIDSNVPVDWYSNDLTKDSANDIPLSPSTELVPGEYFAGTAGVECLTTRSKLVIKNPQPPLANPNQSFCELSNPTLSDIQVSGTSHKYYETEEDLYSLNPGTLLEDGKTYYISSSYDCESIERTAVNVQVVSINIIAVQQSFCATGTDLSQPIIGDLQAPEGYEAIWYDTVSDQKDGTPALSSSDLLIDGEDYYLHIPDGQCETTQVTVTLVPAPNAGINSEEEFCSNDASTYNLVDYIDDSDFGPADRTGTFDPVLENNEFSPQALGPGAHPFTYTVQPTDPCSEPAQSIITVIVNEAPDAGASPESIVCYSDIMTQETFNQTFDSLFGDRDTSGVLSPTREELFTEISAAGNIDSSYETNYTLTDDTTGCQTTATIKLIVKASPNAGVGPSEPVSLCVLDSPVDLFDYFTDSALGAPDAGGTITPALAGGSTIFDPAVDAGGEYTYTVSNQDCEDHTATITIVVIPEAYAGEDTTFNFCVTEGSQNLYDRISDLGISTNGTFTTYANGEFNPSMEGPGEYTTVYTVEPTDNCGTADQATFTLVVNDIPNPPATTSNINGCVSQGLTVANLSASAEDGNTLRWYSDAGITIPALQTDILISGTYYATQVNAAGCESTSATPAEVVINDAPTPTLTQGGNEFCMIDKPTIGDIAMNETGITWYDAPTGGNILSTSDMLQNGAVQYASLTDSATGCESSVRLAVTAIVEKCPLPIPQAFSPNGDGVNDRFVVDFIAQQYPNFTIKVFNRWGQPVFTGNASNNTWDGTSNKGSLGSDVVPVGVYFYVIEYNDGETTPAQGTLYLSR